MTSLLIQQMWNTAQMTKSFVNNSADVEYCTDDSHELASWLELVAVNTK